MEFWTMLTAISALITAGVIVITAIFAAFQLIEASKSRKANIFMNIAQFLQREHIREARGTLIKTSRREKDFNKWTDEEKGSAEQACSTYNVAGIMVKRNLIEPDFVVKEWNDSIIKCWEAAQPMVEEYRKTRGRTFWNDFEELYKKAKELKTS